VAAELPSGEVVAEFGVVVAVALLALFMPSKALSMFELSVDPPEAAPEIELVLATAEKAVLAALPAAVPVLLLVLLVVAAQSA